MSFTGAGSFGNYDLTAQSTGAPLGRTTTNDQQREEVVTAGGSSPGRNENDVSRTRATSLTEVADSEAVIRNEKGNITDAADEDEEAIEEERRHSAVLALARKYTSQSHYGVEPGTNVFEAALQDENSPINPNGPNFNSKAWAKAVVSMMDGRGASFRTSGVAFQHLNVFGFGAPTDYQKDVANVWLELVGLARKLTGNKGRRIDILRDFDGVVEKGEMLVVLGPPGSGCSTFLKTIAGDYNGIYMDENSYFNYQGM